MNNEIAKITAMLEDDNLLPKIAITGLKQIMDDAHTGPLNEGEIAALAHSPMMRPWMLQTTSAYGMYAWLELQQGNHPKLQEYLGTIRPMIRATLRELAEDD